MAFIDERLPVKISLGSGSGISFQTDIVVYGNGKEYVNSRWESQRNTFDISYVVKNRQEAIEVYNFFLTAKGRFNTFRVKDNLDFTSNANGATAPTGLDQTIGVGDGSKVQYQLTKTYNVGLNTYTRNITKPVDGTVTVRLDGVTTNNYTVDTNTGIITFTVTPTLGQVITAGYEFDVHARFNQDSLENIDYIILRQDSDRDRFNFPPLEIIEVI